MSWAAILTMGMSVYGPSRTSGDVRLESGKCAKADHDQVAVTIRDFMSTRPSVMGPMRSSPPCDRHAAELTLLSVVDAEAATLCC